MSADKPLFDREQLRHRRVMTQALLEFMEDPSDANLTTLLEALTAYQEAVLGDKP